MSLLWIKIINLHAHFKEFISVSEKKEKGNAAILRNETNVFGRRR